MTKGDPGATYSSFVINGQRSRRNSCRRWRRPIQSAAMLDIRLIREKPDFVRERLATRGGGDEAKIDEVLRLDLVVRKAQTELQKLYAERNRLSKEIGVLRSKGQSTTDLINRVNEGAALINRLEQELAADKSETSQHELLLQIPNLPHDSVPFGKD